ncbi:hypothetical protein [Streptomyces shenzhenensis]|uniref:hypothetical protein n=1 Tax=Streptomyces shenzhenensis TaxID=943815 RepID=UPI0015F017FB|nr:hypothetical protein [Streptomyces shenzhenensis]
MRWERWQTGEGLLGLDDPAEWDAAFERGEDHLGTAEDAIGDTLTFVPFRDLPPWFKRRWVYVTVRGTLEHWWLRCTDAVEDGRRILRGRRLR